MVLFPTIFGNIVAGPTAEEQVSRSDASVEKETLKELIAGAVHKMLALADMPVAATYAGIRPATEQSPYRCEYDEERHWITLGGIRSTGLTSALGLAQHVREVFLNWGVGYEELETPTWPTMPNLAEHRPRDHAKPGYGEIVCHCEMVTDREIKAALSATVPARNFGGLKRRTRATMGRCQGFHCSAKLAELSQEFLDIPMGMKARGDR